MAPVKSKKEIVFRGSAEDRYAMSFLKSKFVPGVEQLPVYKTVPTEFYSFRFDGFPHPNHHWVFAAEIVDDTNASNKKEKNRVVVRDLTGDETQICFFYEKDAPVTFKWKNLRKGHTIFVMYAEKDDKCVRVDALDYVYIVAASLEECLEGKVKEEIDSIEQMCQWDQWKDVYHPFEIKNNLPIQDDFFGKGNVE
jgi:hypothetical protein